MSAWTYDSDDDYCPYCDEYGQDCGDHGDLISDAVEVFESLSRPPHLVFDDDPWITVVQPKQEYL